MRPGLLVPKSASRYVIPVSVIAIVLVLMVAFRVIPADVVVRLGLHSLHR